MQVMSFDIFHDQVVIMVFLEAIQNQNDIGML